MNKKVLVVATSSKTRGGITSVINAYKSSKLWKDWNCKWIETHIDRSKTVKLWYAIAALIEFVISLPFVSMVHIHLSGPVSTKRKQIFIRLTKWFRKPLIIHFHAFSADSNIDIGYKKLYFKTFTLADIVVVLSNSWKKGLIHDLGILEDKIEVIYNPCPIIEFKESRKKENLILYAGTLNERKNYKTLIKAFAIIAKEFPNWELVLAGNGEVEQAIHLAKILDVKNQVHCKGWISGADKHQLFSKASIFCLPSFAEGFPMAVLDAWAYGLPVITTPVGGIPDIAIDGENIILFNADEVQSLAEKLKQLIIDRALQIKLSNAALNFASKQFSLKEIINKVNELYTKLYENKY